MLAGGIYQAMITTAAGLSVAIPVLICYHWISARIDTLVADIDHLSVDFVDEFGDGHRPSPPAATTVDGEARPEVVVTRGAAVALDAKETRP